MAEVAVDMRANAALLPAPTHAVFTGFSEAIGEPLSWGRALSAAPEAIGQGHGARAASASAPETAHSFLVACALEGVVRRQTDFAKRPCEAFVQHSTKRCGLGCSLVGAGAGASGVRAKN